MSTTSTPKPPTATQPRKPNMSNLQKKLQGTLERADKIIAAADKAVSEAMSRIRVAQKDVAEAAIELRQAMAPTPTNGNGSHA